MTLGNFDEDSQKSGEGNIEDLVSDSSSAEGERLEWGKGNIDGFQVLGNVGSSRLSLATVDDRFVADEEEKEKCQGFADQPEVHIIDNDLFMETKNVLEKRNSRATSEGSSRRVSRKDSIQKKDGKSKDSGFFDSQVVGDQGLQGRKYSEEDCLELLKKSERGGSRKSLRFSAIEDENILDGTNQQYPENKNVGGDQSQDKYIVESSGRRRSVNLTKLEDVLQKQAEFASPLNGNPESLENLTPNRLKKRDNQARCDRIEPRLEQSQVFTPGRSSLKSTSRILARSIPDMTGSQKRVSFIGRAEAPKQQTQPSRAALRKKVSFTEEGSLHGQAQDQFGLPKESDQMETGTQDEDSSEDAYDEVKNNMSSAWMKVWGSIFVIGYVFACKMFVDNGYQPQPMRA